MTTRRIQRGRAYRNDGDEDDPAPEFVASGGPPHPPRNLPKFPNNIELVFEEEHSELLSALLPALNKYNCLLFTSDKPRRSPWVRAFCDLYHPAGPWGSNKFSNAPDITTNRKYSFKSYQIPTLYKQLKKYKGDNEVHQQLKAALEDYFGKEDWHKEFLQGCEKVAAIEVNKPLAERAPIPTEETGLVVAGVIGADQDKVTTADVEVVDLTEGETNATAGDAASPPTSRRRRKRDNTETNEYELPRTRSRVRQQPLASQLEANTTHVSPVASRESVSPESTAGNSFVDNDQKKEALERKREELVELVSKRRSNPSKGKDLLSEKIQSQIDKLDEELLELILA